MTEYRHIVRIFPRLNVSVRKDDDVVRINSSVVQQMCVVVNEYDIEPVDSGWSVTTVTAAWMKHARTTTYTTGSNLRAAGTGSLPFRLRH